MPPVQPTSAAGFDKLNPEMRKYLDGVLSLLETAPADKTLLAQILSLDAADRAGLIARLADKDLQKKMTALLPEIAQAAKVRKITLALEAEIKEVGGKLICTPSGPQWLYLATGDTGAEIFDIPAAIDLYNGNNPLKEQGGRNEKVTDEWLKKLSGVQHAQEARPGELRPSRAMACSIGMLTGLREINLTRTPVKDDALKHLGGLTELRMLGLASTQCNGTGFSHLKGLKKLESVNFHFTPLNDDGLRAITQVPISGRLWFAHTKFTDEGAESLKNLTQLKRCGLGSTVKGSSGEAVAALTKLPLEDLSLLDNQASPVGLAHATRIVTLRKLDVSHAPTVKDESMQLVAQMPALEEFKLSSVE